MAGSIGVTDGDLVRARDDLYQGHWMQVADGADLFRLHPLIQQFFVGKMREVGQQETLRQWFVTMLMAIAREIPEELTRQQLPTFEKVIPHLKIVTERFLDAMSDDDLVWSFMGIARFYQAQGLYGLAEPWYEQCVEVTRSALGEDHPFYAASLNNLALFYDIQGRYGEAEPLYRQALEITRSALGKDCLFYATSLGNLASLYDTQGRYGEAEKLYQRALEIRRSALGENHLLYANSLDNLASFYESQRRYDEAGQLYDKALKIRKLTLGIYHPSYATSLNNLASWYQSTGSNDGAEFTYLLSLKITRSALGEDHLDYATSLHNLACLYKSQGRYGEAEPLYRQSLEIKRLALGKDHPSYATSLMSLAFFYIQSFNPWKWIKASKLSIQAVNIGWKALGWKHTRTRLYLKSLFTIFLLQAVWIWMLSLGFFLSLKTHNLLPIIYAILFIFLIILYQRSNLQIRLWAKAKHKLSRRK
jgi:tetratricopeptide (TPR) repeat protein